MIKFPTTKRVDLYKTAVSSEQLHLDLVAAQEFMFDAGKMMTGSCAETHQKSYQEIPLCADAYSFYCEISQEPPESKSGSWRLLCTQPALHLARIFRSSQDVSGDLSKHVHI